MISTFLLLCTGGHNDDVGLAGVFVRASADTGAGVAVEGGVGEVLDLGVADFGLGVDHEDLAGDGVHDERVGNCSANMAGADNGDLRGETGVRRHVR